MQYRNLLLFLLATLAAVFFYWFSPVSSAKEKRSPSQAGAAFQQWSMARTYPDGKFHTEKYSEALTQMHFAAQLRDERSNPVWEDLGPKNIGGRTLCLAIHPTDTNILWLGSASGGIWKSTTAGRGANAWQRIETGFPLLGVSALAIDPSNPEIIYAGTGEVYNVESSSPNVAIRVTRGTYGIGILKSNNGGISWSKSLDWGYGDLRGVQDLKINPLRPATVLAATTEGLLRSWDAGATWHTLHNKRMAVDIEIDPADTTRIYVTHGSLDDQDASGVYRSSNGGASFSKLAGGLPATFSGKTMIDLCPGQPNVLYASVANSFQQIGLFKSENSGDSWVLVNTEDVAKYQGWYSHDVAVHPSNPNTLIWVGIDTWKSINSGSLVTQKSYWYNWNFGYVPAGASEGPPDYVHADIHRAYYVPTDASKVYLVSDGGLFVSYDGGDTWAGRNGGYQTQQFYANLGNSNTNSEWAIGGMQDNSTAIYFGDPSWIRVLGGDGECAAIHPQNDQIMFGSSQYLNLYKSTNGGEDWYGIGSEIDETAAFNGPFEIAPSQPEIMYAGAQSLWRSDDSGETWENMTGIIANNSLVLTMAIPNQDPDVVYLSTVPRALNVNAPPRLFKFNVSTQDVQELTGLPDRFCMDIAVDPTDENRVLAVFAGFDTPHVWESKNGGASWQSIYNGLPDVPTNSILIDPATGHLYVGNDLGVWHSADDGLSWDFYSADAPQALLAMHLSIAPGNKLRVASYGLGVWQTDLAEASDAKETLSDLNIKKLWPNPAAEQTTLDFNLKTSTDVSVRLLDISGKTLWQSGVARLSAGNHSRNIPTANLPVGTYGVVLESKKGKTGKMLVVAR
ncbi:MAG: T9SS type A sorting domain-containing protein [Saprospiraceae bacterium]|nr:T9SS type A sorting domain-containing protein [Saprospiraceae bacterium]